MNLKGSLVFEYEADKVSVLSAKLLDMDNRIAPKSLKIETKVRGKKVYTMLSSNRVSTFFSTIDDLIFSEKLIHNTLAVGGG